MHLVVFSHKLCWPDAASPGGFATDGGFPRQMEALAQLFDRTTLVLPSSRQTPPPGLQALRGRSLEVATFAEPPGAGFRRKLGWLVAGLPRLVRLWRWAGRGDAVHAAVPGDIGFLGLLLALARRRRILVRHCGTWGRPATLADRLLHRLLLRVADDRCVVLATGGGDGPPSPENASIDWIFSTSLWRRELDSNDGIDSPEADVPRVSDLSAPRLISVGRLTAGKNGAAAVHALAELRSSHPEATLEFVGHGPEEQRLRSLARDLDLGDRVRFAGNVDHGGVMERLRASDVFLFPTRVAEGFPKAVLEALACGLPVVVPSVSVLPHLLRQGGGVVVADVTPATVAGAVRDLLANPEAYRRHSDRAREIARRHTLEAWRDAIGRRLQDAWGVSLGGREGQAEGDRP